MQVIIGIYLTIYAALFFCDAAISFAAMRSGKAITMISAYPYLRAAQYVMGIYLISMMGLVIAELGSVTDGFVVNTTIILSIFAIAYLIEFCYSRYKLKDSIMIVALMTKKELKAQSAITNMMGDNYIKKADLLSNNWCINRADSNNSGAVSADNQAADNVTSADVTSGASITEIVPTSAGIKARKKAAIASIVVGVIMLITMVILVAAMSI